MTDKEHPYDDLLTAVSEGKPLQQYDPYNGEWYDVEHTLGRLFREMSRLFVTTGDWGSWRIKPNPAVEIVTHMFVEPVPKLDNAFNKPNLKLTFDGETKTLMKAEVL